MQGPYHADLYDPSRPVASWWRAEAGEAEAARAPLSGPLRVEAAVIGAGYAGLACAAALARAGVETVALDAGEIGWGASGRNGGIVGLASDKLGVEALVARFGEGPTRAYVEAQVEGARELRALCAAAGVPAQGEAETVLATTRRAFARFRAGARWGVETEMLSADAYAERGFASPRVRGAMLVRPGFGLHPLRLARALAAEAERAGARLHPRTEVLAWRREGGLHLLETARGPVRARLVALATNGFTPDALHPAFRARAMPVLSMIGVTRPLSAEELARHRFVEANPFATAARMLYYARLLPERRLLFGMRGDLDGSEARAGRWRARLRRHLAGMFPEWREVGLDFFWRGPICATRALRPAVGLLPDDPTVGHAFGWHGSGVNGARIGGRLLAGALLAGTDAAIPAPWRGLPPPIPAPGLRRLWLGATLALYRLRDGLDAL